jgi:hypothetical protein
MNRTSFFLYLNYIQSYTVRRVRRDSVSNFLEGAGRLIIRSQFHGCWLMVAGELTVESRSLIGDSRSLSGKKQIVMIVIGIVAG